MHIDAQTRIAESCGIEFPVRYAQINRAKAFIGMRRLGQAARILSMLEREMKNEPSDYFSTELPVQRARLYMSVGDLDRAIDVLSLGPFEHSSRGGRAEFLGWQALVSAAADELDRAHRLAAEARLASRGLEARTLSLLAEAIAALGRRDTAVATARIQAVIDGEIWDPVVMAVRIAPSIGSFIADNTAWRGWLQRLLFASSDSTLASRLGLRVPRAAKRRAELTPRESEVHELLAQGLTNEEIAKLLYISLSTTKVHVKHIYDKLGVRSRLEAARALGEDV
jgi:DNA-binding NarL/FixJ family response regulator